MDLKKLFVTVRDNYVKNQVKQARLPQFAADEVVRYRVTFSGLVQHVGFRLEVCELAQRLSLTGFCQNLENGDVLAEVQGPENRILYLISFMESLKRIKIREKTVEKLALDEKETEFIKKV